jgi:hypothetical protein
MAGNASGEVERLEPWQLGYYLRKLEADGSAEVTWNKQALPIGDAKARAEHLSPTATVVADGTTIYVAEPDHSADDTPRLSPIQLGPRR